MRTAPSTRCEATSRNSIETLGSACTSKRRPPRASAASSRTVTCGTVAALGGTTIRALRPEHVVETGTDKGLGSSVIAAALLRNGTGRLTTIDINLDSGYLIGGPYDGVIAREFGDSIAVLADGDPVDFFIHDSLHTEAHERGELDALAPRLTRRSIVVSDNAHSTSALATWAEETGRRFLFFAERPKTDRDPGAGIGVAWHRG